MHSNKTTTFVRQAGVIGTIPEFCELVSKSLSVTLHLWRDVIKIHFSRTNRKCVQKVSTVLAEAKMSLNKK